MSDTTNAESVRHRSPIPCPACSSAHINPDCQYCLWAEAIARALLPDKDAQNDSSENYGEYGWAARDDAHVDTCEVEKVEGERPAGGAATKCPHCGMPMARRLMGEFCMNDDCPGFPKGASDE